MSYPGYSRDEYTSEVREILVKRYGIDRERARNLVWDSLDVRYYSGHGRSSSPSALANKIARAARLKKVALHGPTMGSGYAQKYTGRGEWEVVVVDEEEINRAKFQGWGRIDGTPHALWKVGRTTYAQVAVGHLHPSHFASRARHTH